MQNATHILGGAASRSPTNAPLFRLTFVGGPHDGAELPAAMLPANRLELAVAPAVGGTRQGRAATPRMARYRLQNLRLDTAGSLPVVSCRFEYYGTVAAHMATTDRWWTRYFDALRQWLEPCPRRAFVRNAKRSIAHV